MNKRRILYGYIIQNGELTITPKEAEIVRQIFVYYLDGLSYQGIANKLNSSGIVFSAEAPKWDKHKVKRVLEDCRYTGKHEYPPIIQPELFEKIQLIIQTKTANYRRKPSTIDTEEQTAVVPMKTIYTSSVEVAQIENTINRALEQRTEPKIIMKLIIQEIEAKYKCIMNRR